ncbi:hypothetical protein FNV43_RR13335 [Rhamnella rubrinervis]|uniref:Uncharacterized protein n=1 Tax=Rhamnella rubrinervis TaxID=2594499 RepID=A0A8K0MF11_9ROSA|nr:hypothetical protein FNV43_RR13335 [Rhamnella rubrinervis]
MSQLTTSMTKLEPKTSGKLPSQPVNPREETKAMTLRSGREVEMPKKDAKVESKKPQFEEEVEVQPPLEVNNMTFLADFYILHMEDDYSPESSPIILGRPFLKTAKTKIDVYNGTLSMEFYGELIKFDIIKDIRACQAPAVAPDLALVLEPVISRVTVVKTNEPQAPDFTLTYHSRLSGSSEAVLELEIVFEFVHGGINDIVCTFDLPTLLWVLYYVDGFFVFVGNNCGALSNCWFLNLVNYELNMEVRTSWRSGWYIFLSPSFTSSLGSRTLLFERECSMIRSIVRSKRRAKSLCYPLFLSKVFAFCGADVIGEDITVSGPTDVLTEANLYWMGYVWVRGVWCNLVRYPLHEGEIADSHIAPIVNADDKEEHSECIEDICTSLATRQDVMKTRLQHQDEQLQQIRALLEHFPPPPS